ncbi:uncharacterized protein LOC121624289 [Chelmon rostratus]|uniref:uncharacterized protein LOC121624289 n=1 Tax=Chelmon rostratus TaxID=109905 RepID=UPI001BE5657F|nr:uncharacterized protein LOC121624289 [Chelmon rostratus]
MASPVPLSKANTTFSLALFKKLSDDDKTGNIFFSPFSISAALAMVMMGTRGNTATQMSQVLCFTESDQPKLPGAQPSMMQSQMETRMQMRTQLQQSTRLPLYLLKVFSGCSQCLKPQNDQDNVHAKFAQLLGKLNETDASYTLSLANRLYGEQSYQFVEDFLSETKKYYNAELESVDFKGSPEAARVQINSWVEKQTQGEIKDMLIQGVVDDMTRLVLVNAIYFKGDWNKKFEEEFTVDAQFRVNKNVTKAVKMMCQKSKFPLTSIPEVNCQILEMPYQGGDLSMLIFLPDDIEDDTTGLEKLEKELTYEKFVDWTCPDLVGQTEVEVKLPRFKMEESYDLKDVLVSMGMVDAFDVSLSDFSGMSPANDLLLSKVVHKAFVEVNEEGTEAAGATTAILTDRSILIPGTFIADHPFLFFIRHNPTMSILFAGRYSSPEHKMASPTPLTKANTMFSLALFKKLSEVKAGNVFFSPFSISAALAMAMQGARGNTARQMAECLKTQDCQDEVHVSFAQLLSELNQPDAPYALSIANRLYGEQSFHFVEDFFTQTRTHYNAELETVDFKTNTELARVSINSWVEKQTQGKIKDAVAEDMVNRFTVLVLVNAIYFKGTWNEPFLHVRTHDAEFRVNKNDTKPVEMMRHKTYFPFAFVPEANCKVIEQLVTQSIWPLISRTSINCFILSCLKPSVGQILEMPYKGKELSMLIFLPEEIEDNTTGLEKLEKQLTYKKFVKWTRPDVMTEAKVDVRLPRFKMEENYDLNDVLKSMGMRDAFDETKSDFSGLSEAETVFISMVAHKAFVEVNEEGTEAAAATSVYCENLCCNPDLVNFIADHPFLFFIRHNTTMSVLFAGRFCSPV